MSTHIETIIGEKESSLSTDNRVPTNLHLTRFYGGDKNGRMLQLTITNNEGYIQLTRKEVIELSVILANSFDNELYPSE